MAGCRAFPQSAIEIAGDRVLSRLDDGWITVYVLTCIWWTTLDYDYSFCLIFRYGSILLCIFIHTQIRLVVFNDILFELRCGVIPKHPLALAEDSSYGLALTSCTATTIKLTAYLRLFSIASPNVLKFVGSQALSN